MNLTTERLILTPVNHAYDKDIFEHFNDEITVYMSPSSSTTLENTYNVVENFMRGYATEKEYVYAILLKDNQEFVGLCGLHDMLNKAPELGIWTRKSYHGNHYGREAIGALVALARLKGYKKLVYPVDARNIASVKIPLYYGGKLSKKAKKVKSDDKTRVLLIEKYEIEL